MKAAEFVRSMWRQTIIPLALTFVISLTVVGVDLTRYFLGDTKVLTTDSFNFCLFVAAALVPMYLFFRIVKAIVAAYAAARDRGSGGK